MAKKFITNSEDHPIKHIGFIMDGNGRWAKKRGMPREYGHKFGAETFKKVMEHCCNLGIKATTFYVFSTENWKRPQKEVDSIMKLLDRYLDDCKKELDEYDLRFIFLGDKSVFPDGLRNKMIEIERLSSQHKYIVNLALNYGGRDEIVYAVNKLYADGKERITEDDISSALYTSESPDLDLIVRTGGDLRISNFLLWQSAYAELYFTDKLWPDFNTDDVDAAIENFLNRKRRFGGV
ncbi:MAG: di-trans,poly-cis-decaprenylcistransferase [Ruminococcaceae bacterium]|nr:di-trans,poly-cis-decaprenylcistransferase [Oscillospiraceae bacterium]